MISTQATAQGRAVAGARRCINQIVAARLGRIHPTHWLICAQARELKQKGKKAQDEANAKAKAAGQEPSPCAEAEAHLQQSREVAKELEKGSSYELTGAKLEKKEQLLREGFVDWSATRRGDVSIYIYIYIC